MIEAMSRAYKLYDVIYRYVKGFKNMGLSSKICLGKKWEFQCFILSLWTCEEVSYI
jgi:hypothetical protein